jgi:hypothetical protein
MAQGFGVNWQCLTIPPAPSPRGGGIGFRSTFDTRLQRLLASRPTLSCRPIWAVYKGG